MSIALRVVAIAVWGVFMVGMASWSNTDAAMIGVGIGTVVLGVLVGRWWVLLVPIVPGALLALGTLVSDPDDYYEGSPGLWAAFVALWTVGIAALLALGVAVNRSVARVARFRTHGGGATTPNGSLPQRGTCSRRWPWLGGPP